MKLKDLIDNIEGLPPMPQVFPKLQELIHDEDLHLVDILSVLKIDAPLMAQVIRLSNSSYYSFSAPCENLEEAVNRIGFKEVYKLVTLISLKPYLKVDIDLYKQKSDQFFTESLVRALLLEGFFYFTNLNTNTGYTLGLVSSIGKILLSIFIKTTISDKRKVQNLSPEEAEKLFGFNFAQAGAYLLDRWNFPENIMEPVLHQLEPEKSTSNKQQTYLLNFAEQLTPLFPHKIDKGAVVIPEGTELDKDRFSQALESARSRYKDTRVLISTF